MKQTFNIPARLGWLVPTGEVDENEMPTEYTVDWTDNNDNFTEKQCLVFCDVVSDETKTVERLISDEDFEIFLNKWSTNS